MTIRTSLQHLPRHPTTDDDKRALAKTAWHKGGDIDQVWGCVLIGDIQSWDVKEIIIQELNRQYGRRLGK